MPMANCLPCVHIKHATLIENCYPLLKDVGTTPRSSELSYLTFYASSKPAKLTKVGTYIQNKVERDIRKGRKNYNLVSLHIIQALIQTCHRDLNIFSKYIVNILSMLLDTRDLEIIDLTSETFIVFCSYHDGSTLGVDLSFTTDYENLLEKFSGFCNYANNDHKMQYIGHRAIQAAVTSSAFEASDFKTQVHILFTPLIITLASSKKTLPTSPTDVQDSVLNKQDINADVITLLASNTVSALFSHITGSSVRRSLVPLFEYLNEKEKWGQPELAVNILKLALESVQPQYRYLLVSDILLQLDNLKDSYTEKHVALVLILESISNAQIPLAGISVLEVLNTLFNHIIKSLQANGKQQVVIHHGLVKSIGGLASQIYYDNQLNDMASYLISKLRTNTTLDYIDSMSIHDYRVVVLSCLDSIIRGSNTLSSMAGSRVNGACMTLDTWNPALDLLQDKNPHTRIVFSNCLYQFLQSIPTTLESIDGYPKHTLTDRHDIIFMNRLVHVFHEWVLIPDFNVADLKHLYALLCLLSCKFGVDGTITTVPLVFRIQQLVQEEKISLRTRQLAIESALIEWLLVVAQSYKVDSLISYAKTLISQRPANCIDLSLGGNQVELFSTQVNVTPNRPVIDRSIVVEGLSKELRDELDPHGLDLEAKLFAEWGYDAMMRNDQIHRMKIVQEINEIKPHLSSPWELDRPPVTSEDRKNSIRVANLKEALVGQLAAADEDDADTSSSQSHPISTVNYSKSLPIKPNDIGALFNELNLSEYAPSTVSLVNPPY